MVSLSHSPRKSNPFQQKRVNFQLNEASIDDMSPRKTGLSARGEASPENADTVNYDQGFQDKIKVKSIVPTINIIDANKLQN